MSNSWPIHGGRLRPLLARFGLPQDQPMLDFSANINPLGPPGWLIAQLGAWLGDVATSLGRYPDPDDCSAEQAIAKYNGVGAEQVLVTNGGIEAIFLAAALHSRPRAGQRALIITPTFAEYARACAHYGLAVTTLVLEADPQAGHAAPMLLNVEAVERAMPGCALVFICRPNNPTGSLVPKAAIQRLLDVADRHGTTLVVDEAFIDFTPQDEALTDLLGRYSNLILLRSMTKFYAVPGLRLGYLLAAKETRRHLAERQMSWSVNALAKALVVPLLSDVDYAARTHAWLDTERSFPERLAKLGFVVPPSHANFYLLGDIGNGQTLPDASEALMEFLLQRGFVARHTHNFAGLDGHWLRLALHESAANRQLFGALEEWKSQRHQIREGRV
ncbi:MAG: threonine-phosphate decarboxylase CobD [Halomonas sp.]|uniref:threonine-phosphate decarboxylase CobD n=1 Tax=Halomonas sp. TaxID=1486246 RepID=UPI003F9399CE